MANIHPQQSALSPRSPVAADGGLQHRHFVPLSLWDGAVVLLINLLWGLNLVAIKMATHLVGPLTSSLLRQIIVMLVCIGALRIMPGRMRTLLTLGVLTGGVFYIALSYSLALGVNVASLAIASQLGAPISILLGVFVLKEHVGRWRIAGIALAFIGVAVLVFHPGGAGDMDAIGLTVISSSIWAVGSLLQRNLSGVPVLTIYAWMSLIGTLVLLPVTIWQESDLLMRLPDLPLRHFGWVVFSALGSTLIGQGGMSWLLQRHPLSTVAPLTLLSPIVAVTSSTMYFGTALSTQMIVGGMIALVGVAIVTIRSAWWRDQSGRTR
jgi:O-acetylserine/cysteine efflux transporter